MTGGLPPVIRLAGRIEDDLDGIRKLAEYEKKHGIDIANFML